MIDRVSRSIPGVGERTSRRHLSSPSCQLFQAGLGKVDFGGKPEDRMLDDALKQRPSLLPPQMRKLERDDAIYRWDQPAEEGQSLRGWRLLSSQGKNREALRQVAQVLEAHPPDKWPSRLGRHIVAFHGLQLAVQEGEPQAKIESLARNAEDPKDKDWNAYVRATTCFALGDKRGFEASMTMSSGNLNERVMKKLEANFGKKTYTEAYSS